MSPLRITVDDTSNPRLKHVLVSTYGLVGEFSLARGQWGMHWCAGAAALTAKDYDTVFLHTRALLKDMNVLHNVTQRLTR